ncbi:MAG: hypothetical protein LUH21_13770 [Clostridiales bacterium]|nr:hypothetical protein [Clostridiales bacterium]
MAVAELLTTTSSRPLLKLGIRDRFSDPDTYENLLEESGLTPDGIALSIKAHLERRNHVKR